MNEYVIAFSGGKDSTCLALRWHELGKSAKLLFTPTGDEFPDLQSHINKVVAHTGFPLIEAKSKLDLYELIDHWNALPNWRQRWCTRILKIEPAKAVLQSMPDATLLVGLRADEEERVGIYSEDITTRFPLREWGFDLQGVTDYLNRRGVVIPLRTDCRLCFFQRIHEWYLLWENYPEVYQRGVDLEEKTGRTFRSKSRDTWPASLKELRDEFIGGRIPGKIKKLRDGEPQACRVCSL